MITLNITNKDLFINSVLGLYNEITYPCTITVGYEDDEDKAEKGTDKQLNYFWSIMPYVAMYLNKNGYRDMNAENCCHMFYYLFGIYEPFYLPTGEPLHYPKKTLSKMGKKKRSQFIDSCMNWINENKVIIPPNTRNCWLLHIEDKDIENVMSYKIPQNDDCFLRFQARQTCLHCGAYGVEVHHIRDHTGLALKEPDWYSIPLCRKCHDALQKGGTEELSKELPVYGFSMDVYCRLVYDRWYYKK